MAERSVFVTWLVLSLAAWSAVAHIAFARSDAIRTGPMGGGIRVLAIDPVNRDILYAGTTHGILKSADGGAMWDAASTGIGDQVITALAVDPTTPTTVYAGTFFGLFRSLDGGGTWRRCGRPRYVLAVAVNRNDPRVLYVGGDGMSLLRFAGSRIRWSPMNRGLPAPNGGVEAIVVAPGPPLTLYAGIYGFGIFRYDGPDGCALRSASREYNNSIFTTALAIGPKGFRNPFRPGKPRTLRPGPPAAR